MHIQNKQCINLIKELIDNVTDQNFIWGISINYNLESELYKKVENLLIENLSIKELLVCLPNKEKDSWKFDVETIKLLQKLKLFKERRNIRIGIDRDVIPHRISFAAKFDISHFVIGKYIYQNNDTQQVINYLRDIYEQAKSSHH